MPCPLSLSPTSSCCDFSLVWSVRSESEPAAVAAEGCVVQTRAQIAAQLRQGGNATVKTAELEEEAGGNALAQPQLCGSAKVAVQAKEKASPDRQAGGNAPAGPQFFPFAVAAMRLREAKRQSSPAAIRKVVAKQRGSIVLSMGRAREAVPSVVTPQTRQARCPDRECSRSRKVVPSSSDARRLDRSSGRKKRKLRFPKKDNSESDKVVRAVFPTEEGPAVPEEEETTLPSPATSRHQCQREDQRFPEKETPHLTRRTRSIWLWRSMW